MSELKNLNNKRKRALITGILGQDGYYLSHFLAAKGYKICGLTKDKTAEALNGWSPKAKSKIKIIVGDLADQGLMRAILEDFKPDEIYNLAAVSDLATSFKYPALTMRINCEAPANIIKQAFKMLPEARIFMASSAQIFDKSNPPQNELTPFKAENPYAMAKLKLHQEYVLPFRKRGLFVCSGFLFNHESPRREDLIIRKVTKSFVQIKFGLLDCLELGNLEATRDWGFAGDYVRAMWQILRQNKPDDFVIATGKAHTVRDLVEVTADRLGISIKWRGQGLNEVGLDQNGKIIIKINRGFYRLENSYFLGDTSKIKKEIGWRPKINFNELVKMMVEDEMKTIVTPA